MIVTVIFHTALQQVTAEGRVRSKEVELPEKTQLSELLQRLEVDWETLELMLVVNRKTVDPDTVLQDGDVVDLIPALSGGDSPGFATPQANRSLIGARYRLP
jgi:molybdopterin converting factor small subunit